MLCDRFVNCARDEQVLEALGVLSAFDEKDEVLSKSVNFGRKMGALDKRRL